MVTKHEAMELIRDTIDADPRIPDRMDYVIHEADAEGQQANVSLPFIELQITSSSRDDLSNSNLIEFIEDDSGNRVGRLFETKWDMTLQLDVWTADGSSYDVNELGQTVHMVLYDHDVKGPALPFEDENGQPVDELWNFKLTGNTRQDDLGQTPTVRRYRQRAEVYGAERYAQTGEEYVQAVNETTTT